MYFLRQLFLAHLAEGRKHA